MPNLPFIFTWHTRLLGLSWGYLDPEEVGHVTQDQRVPARRPRGRGEGRRHPGLGGLPAGPRRCRRPVRDRRTAASRGSDLFRSFTKRAYGVVDAEAPRDRRRRPPVSTWWRPCRRVRRPGAGRARVRRPRPPGRPRRAARAPGPGRRRPARSTTSRSARSSRPAASATPTSAPSTSCSASRPGRPASSTRATLKDMGLTHERAMRGVATALSAYTYARETLTFSGLSAPIRAALEDIRSRLVRLEGSRNLTRATSSPCGTEIQPSGSAAQVRQALRHVLELVGGGRARSRSSWSASAVPVTRSAHIPPHQLAGLGSREAPRARRSPRRRSARPRAPRRAGAGRRPARRRWPGQPPGRARAIGRGRGGAGTTRTPRSRCRGRPPLPRACVTRAISRSAATGSATCWSTWWACTTSNAVVGQVERVHVADPGLGVRDRPVARARPGSAPRPPRWPRRATTSPHESSEVGGDGARAGAHVEEPVGRAQPRQEVRRTVGRRTRPVRPEHALGVTVGVAHRASLSRPVARPGAGVRDQVLEPQLEDLAERHQRGQPWVQRRAGPRLALLELLVRVRRDARQVRGPLLAQPPPLACSLQAHPDLATELVPGRLSTSRCHASDCHGHRDQG